MHSSPLFVPRCRRKIQQFKTNTQRTPNAHGQFSQVWDLAQLLRKKHRCIFMRKPEDGAPAGSRRGKWQIIVASPGSVNDAVLYGTNGHGTDGKYKTVEFNLVTNVISVFKRNDKTSHPAGVRVGLHPVRDAASVLLHLRQGEQVDHPGHARVHPALHAVHAARVPTPLG